MYNMKKEIRNHLKMHYFYVDESGSITKEHAQEFPYFIVALVRVLDKQKLKRKFKRFVSSNLDKLKAQDCKNKMFDINGKFIELKGNCFSPELKTKFIDYFSQEKLFEVYYIKLVNALASTSLCQNKARCFNYLIKEALFYYYNHEYFDKSSCCFQIDERNVRTEAKYLLQEYLNTELHGYDIISEDIQVAYFESSTNYLIQIADVFANFYYSHLLTGNYLDKIKKLKKKKILRHIFTFPLQNKTSNT